MTVSFTHSPSIDMGIILLHRMWCWTDLTWDADSEARAKIGVTRIVTPSDKADADCPRSSDK